ncbi:MAG TPA: hypothetical protein VFY89_08930 [Ktedonobacterales bacterium]
MTTFDGSGALVLRPAQDGDRGFVVKHWCRTQERDGLALVGVRPDALEAGARKALCDRIYKAVMAALDGGHVQMVAYSGSPDEALGFVAARTDERRLLYVYLVQGLRRTAEERERGREGIAVELLRHLGAGQGWTYGAVTGAGIKLAAKLGLRLTSEWQR